MTHDDPHAGHFGRERTFELVSRKYWWKGMYKDIEDYVKSCDICQRIKAKRHRSYGNLQSLPHAEAKWKHLTMDFITGLPGSQDRHGTEFDAILVIVDRFTKMAVYIPCKKTIDAADLADLFIEKITSRFGNPAFIVSDRGTVFTSKFWSTVCYHLKMKSKLSTAFHPQTDGQTERQNQTLEQYLRAYVNFQQDDWVYWIPLAEFAYNNSVHGSTGYTPFFLLMGYHPEINIEPEEMEAGAAPNAQLLTEELELVRLELAERYRFATATQAHYYDLKHKPQTFATGDHVFLSSKYIANRRPSKKLDWKWLGPFKVIEPVGTQSYRLELSQEYGRLHNVFHVSLLELAMNRKGKTFAKPKPMILDGEEHWYVQNILATRIRYQKRQFLVHWKDTSPAIDSWEPMENLMHLDAYKSFLKAHPELQQGLRDSKRRSRPVENTKTKPVKRHRRK